MRDPWGATLNVESGDYKLPDGTTGNTLTNPGPLENYDPGSEVYDDDENGSTATAVGSRENGTPSSNTGSGTANRNNGGGPEILMNDAMPMAIRQSGWALVGFVGVMGVIEWM